MNKLQVVIVTPESTTLDKQVDSVVLPLFDGEKGILANHAPMIGRLGKGKLRIKDGSTEESYQIDGGFVQIESNTVSILTGSSEAVTGE